MVVIFNLHICVTFMVYSLQNNCTLQGLGIQVQSFMQAFKVIEQSYTRNISDLGSNSGFDHPLH